MKVTVIAFSQFLGLDREVRLDQDSGSDGARLIEMAGRVCYDSYGKGRSSSEFHRHLLEVGHGSVLEHASISFHLAGISRACANEWVRHRAGCAVSQRSTRYVDESESEWCWHPDLDVYRAGLTATGEALNLWQRDARSLYRRLVAILLERFESLGIPAAAARKRARGAARGVLGNALATEMVWTANIRAIRNVIEQRATPEADAEIRLLAHAVYRSARQVVPEYFDDYTETPAPDGIGVCLTTEHRKI